LWGVEEVESSLEQRPNNDRGRTNQDEYRTYSVENVRNIFSRQSRGVGNCVSGWHDISGIIPAILGETAMASLNPSPHIRCAGARREIHSLDEFLIPTRPCRFAYRRSSSPG
jgi:hypothetical protein